MTQRFFAAGYESRVCGSVKRGHCRNSRGKATGRIKKGFDFLGYHFSPQGLTLARQRMVNFLERAIRLYEQEPGEKLVSARLGSYVRRSERWTRSGIIGCVEIAPAA